MTVPLKTPIDIGELVPNRGDAATVVNHGDFFQVILHTHKTELTLTDDEISKLINGEVTYQ